MKSFFAPMRELGEFQEIRQALERSAGKISQGGVKNFAGILQVSGCIDSQKAHFMAALAEGFSHRLILAPNDLRAREIYENFKLFDRHAWLLPARDFIFFQADVHSGLVDRERLRVWKALCADHAQREEPLTLITTVTALMNHLMPFEEWAGAVFELKIGDEIDLGVMRRRLVELGYERAVQTEGPGQFAVRGNILDIYPMTEENPVRIELWGDEVDSIRSFDAESQRSIENLQRTAVCPACEMVLTPERAAAGLERIRKEGEKAETAFRKKMKTEEAYRVKTIVRDCEDRLEEGACPRGLEGFADYFFENPISLLDALPKDTLIFLDEPGHINEAADAAMQEYAESMQQRLEKGYALPGQTGMLFSSSLTVQRLSEALTTGLCMLDSNRSGFAIGRRFSVNVQGTSSYNNSFEMLVRDLKRWKKEGSRVILLSASRTRGARLARDLTDEGIPAFFSEDPDRVLQKGEVMVTAGNAHRGYEYPLIRFVVITESDIFGRERTKKRKRQRQYEGTAISGFADLHPGDYVVHESHGLGIYRGIEKIEVNHVIKDYMKIEYQGGSNLFVLATQLDVIQKYADADAKKPKLNKLGTQEWSRTKARVKGAVKNIARELVDLYAIRQKKDGFVYGPDTVWQKEFEELFPFEETEDQLAAIEDTKADMQSTKIMDRLICGDVGYGKTEIALRAAFKAVQEGKQVAYLVPTTILAQQHYNTFVERMKDFPVRVDLMCRFRTNTEIKKTVQDLKKGMVDVVIGTHRILSRDVAFKDLGLLVIDEEQRFGVTHKEKIKQMKTDVDVLSMTATPIPRTLHMSLIGIRDMSVLEEPPLDRQPIQTFVMEYNEELVREAISRELARGGQVYYVYNRVNTIMDMADRVARIVPQARVAFAHGQMSERELEQIMYEFINGDVDVLVSTTIIETGLDIPNANTMIVHDADAMGLSQLYQLRGRIGRSSRTAYAFLMYKRDKMLREVAEKRLSAIREFTELGSGIKIAMRDLEIRGAGNLLGSEQHGHLEAVGYDLYCKLLNESVRELKGEKKPQEEFETSLEIDLDAYIPETYIRNENQKLDIYKRIAAISGQEECDDMLEELLDRFGEPPRTVQNLLKVSLLRAFAHDCYITDVAQKGEELRFVLYERSPVDVAKIEDFIRSYRGRMTFRIDKQPCFIYMRARNVPAAGEDTLRLIREILEQIREKLL